MHTIVAAVIAVAAVAGTLAWWRMNAPGPGGALVRVTVPELSAEARAGKQVFDASCAQCHGRNAAGSDHGPPLVHQIYNPGHHSDAAFFAAAARGSPQHHWHFGDMPPQPQVSRGQVAEIVRYVRELQLANGIVYKRHQM